MDWTNWQTYAALGVVTLTLAIFLWRWLKVRLIGSDKDCCNGGCGCAVSKREKKQSPKGAKQ